MKTKLCLTVMILSLTVLMISCRNSNNQKSEGPVNYDDLQKTAASNTTSSNSFTLSHEDAANLIRNALSLPKPYKSDIGVNGMGQANELNALKQEGLLTWSYQENFGGKPMYIVTLNMTDQIKPYYLGKNSQTQFDMFKTHELDVDQITGISMNQNDQTATVRFTLKASNVTPVGEALNKYNLLNPRLDKPMNGELVFKKFDSGWQLDSDINKSSEERLQQILQQ